MTTTNFVVKNGITVGTASITASSGNANVGNLGFGSGQITGTGNITTTGNSTAGNLSVSGLSNLGAVGNITITGGSASQFLYTNGSGVLAWGNPTVTAIASGNSNISIPAANGNVNFSAAGNANIFVVTGTGVQVAGNITGGSGNGGNITGANLMSANFFVGNSVTISGNVSGVPNVATVAGNLGLRTVSATYTDTSNAATVANAAIHAIATPTMVGSNAMTYTNLATFYVQSNPTAGTNATVTNSFAMFVGSGNTFFGGNVSIGNTAPTNAFSVTGNAYISGNLSAGNVTGATIINSTGNITTTANVSAGYLLGNGQALTALNASNITSGTLPYAQASGLKSAGQQVISTTSTLTSSNYGTNILLTVSGITVTMPATAPLGTIISMSNLSTGNVTISYTGTGGSDGPVTLGPNQNIMLTSDGGRPTSVWRQLAGSPGFVYGGAGFNSTTFAGLTSTGNITATSGIFYGNGAGLSSITGGNVTGTVATATTAGTVTTAAQPNITSFGSLSSLTVTGNTFLATTSGNVGIGTSSPASRLAVGGNPPAAGAIAGVASSGGTSLALSDNVNSSLYVRHPSAGLATLGTDAGGAIAFASGTTERMRMDSSGNLGIGNTAPTDKLSVTGTINASANITGGNIIATNYTVHSVGTGISAAGTTQATATALTKEFNVVSTVLSGNGVTLPTALAGYRITVFNTSANALNVYPLGNGIINSAAANVAFSLPAGDRLDFLCTTTATAPGGQWYTLNATYG